jgi:hypothetical protein
LFKSTEKIVDREKFGGYRANIVTHTLAYLSFRDGKQIDLNWIWKHQSIPQNLEQTIAIVCRKVHETIVNPPNGRNVTEWCKKEACWQAIQKINV